MQAPKLLKDVLYPTRGDLVRLRFTEQGRAMQALIPDDELFSLSREMILQRVYDVPGAPYGTVIDAGAHVGLFTIMVAQQARRVVALEPNAFNFRVLELNRDANDATNVIALRAALWAHDGVARFTDSADHSTGGSVQADGAHEVPARSLDSLIDEHGDVDLLKIDIEGGEVEALPACTRLRRIKRVIGELHRFQDADSLPVERALADAGFDFELIPAAALYAPHHAPKMIRRFGALHGQAKVKAGAVAYALAPIEKPRRPGRDLPLFVATRRD